MNLRWFVGFIILLIGWVLADSERSLLHEALDLDLRTGQLNRIEYLAYQLMGIQNSEHLPEHYRAIERQTVRTGTGYMLEASALVDKTTGSERELLQSVLYRPDGLPLTLTSPSGLFKIHFSDVGYDAAADSFVVQAAAAFDYSYDVIVNQLNFDPPPQDAIDGPEYDVYIYNLGDYGMTTPDGAAPTDSHPDGSVSFIHMDNSFDRTFTRGIDGMLVTAAHEFLHMVQIGYRNFTTSDFDSRWLFEGCAVWMEDFAFDDINDYLQYMPSYFSSLNLSFYTFNGLHEYGTGIFYMMLEQKYGPGVIRSIWEHFGKKEVFEAVDAALRERGSSFSLELSDHMVWNYFTGARANPDVYYAEGEHYPLVQTDETDSLKTTLYLADSANLLGTHYLKIEPQDFGEISIQPEMDSPGHWLYAVIDHPEGERPNVAKATGTSSTLLQDITPASSIHIIPTNVHFPTTRQHDELETFGFTITLGEIGNVEAKIQSIAPNPYQPELHTNGAQFSVRLTEKTEKLECCVATETGRVIFSETILFESPKKGDFSMTWDGRSNDGHFAASGIYIVYFNAAQQIKPGKIAIVR